MRRYFSSSSSCSSFLLDYSLFSLPSVGFSVCPICKEHAKGQRNENLSILYLSVVMMTNVKSLLPSKSYMTQLYTTKSLLNKIMHSVYYMQWGPCNSLLFRITMTQCLTVKLYMYYCAIIKLHNLNSFFLIVQRTLLRLFLISNSK